MRVGTPSRALGCLSEINVTPMADIMIESIALASWP